MKKYVVLVLLTLLCPGGCPVYDIDLKTVDKTNDFSNDLNMAAQLSSEFEQGLMNLNTGNNMFEDDKDSFEVEPQSQAKLSGEDNSEHLRDTASTKLQREANCGDETGTSAFSPEHFVGSNLFDGNRKKCFSPDDAALLAARKNFELLIPRDLTKTHVNDNVINLLMNYFYAGNQIIQKTPEESSRQLLEKAYYDMLGGYLKSYMLPVAKYSYYAGKSSMKTVSNVVALYEQCKSFINTNGNGWKMPSAEVLNQLKGGHIEPLKIDQCEDENEGVPESCTRLEFCSKSNNAEDSKMIVDLPRLEVEKVGCDDDVISNIWLPFKKKRIFDLKSPKSAFIVVRFYETVTRCYKSQSLAQDTYNRKLKAWINEEVQPHLTDETFYPGLGSILRISENLRKGRKVSYVDEENADNSVTNFEDTENEGKLEGNMLETDYIAKDYKEIRDKATQIFGKEENWFDRTYGKPKKSRKICEPKTKKKLPKCKPKVAVETATTIPIIPITVTQESIQRHYIKYLCCLVALILGILVMVLLCALFRRRKKKSILLKDVKKDKPGRKLPKLKICEKFRCRKPKPQDEEIMIKPGSGSVQPLRRSTTQSSTSSLACYPATKCIPITKRGMSDAPVIETTSLDYSSSEPEDKLKRSKKTKSKVVKIDEKKKRKSSSKSPPPKKRTSKSTTSNETPKSRFSLLKVDAKSNSDVALAKDKKSDKSETKTKTSSWETMYES